MKIGKKNSRENLKEEIKMVSLDCQGGCAQEKGVQSSFHMQIPSVDTAFDLMVGCRLICGFCLYYKQKKGPL